MTKKVILNKVDSIDLHFSDIQKSFYKIFYLYLKSGIIYVIDYLYTNIIDWHQKE